MSGQSPVISDRNDPLRPFLKKAIAKMSVVARFDSAENDALESLVELYGALLQSIAEISKEYCEHGNRVVPLIQDVISATTHLGLNLDDNVKNLIAEERNNGNKYPAEKEEFAQIPEPPCVKEIADRKIHQPFVNDFLPPYPEPHTYINSAAVCSNAYRSEFEEVKNSYTNNVRDSQDALARFAAKMEKKLRNEDGTIELITNDEQTSVLTPIGTEIWDYKALNVQEDMEWVCDPKQAASSENATAEQINQNPFIKPPKIQGKNTKR